MRPGNYKFADLSTESRILGTFGSPRPWGYDLDYEGLHPPDRIIIYPVGGPPPPPVFRFPQSTIVSLPDPTRFLVVEWDPAIGTDGEPELHKVNW